MTDTQNFLDWAIELQALAQAGLHYSRDPFDIERFERIRELALEMVAWQVDFPADKIPDLFAADSGYQTPKIDNRAAVFRDGKILLVQESNGRWCLPGGWNDVDLTVRENTIKEVLEEAGLNVIPGKLIALQFHHLHNQVPHLFKIMKVFVECELVGGEFATNNETLAADYFSLDNLPDLDVGKTTQEQLAMCFQAHQDPNWVTLYD